MSDIDIKTDSIEQKLSRRSNKLEHKLDQLQNAIMQLAFLNNIEPGKNLIFSLTDLQQKRDKA
jgi:hypothetical protein